MTDGIARKALLWTLFVVLTGTFASNALQATTTAGALSSTQNSANANAQLLLLSAASELQNPIPTMLLEGLNFLPKKAVDGPRVFMGRLGGIQDELIVLQATDTSILVMLTETQPGTYLVVVTKGNGSVDRDAFDVTLGGGGLAGPPGPEGPEGPISPDGPQGLEGEVGPQGDIGL